MDNRLSTGSYQEALIQHLLQVAYLVGSLRLLQETFVQIPTEMRPMRDTPDLSLYQLIVNALEVKFNGPKTTECQHCSLVNVKSQI
jgi:hypothetical protein